MSLPCDGLRVLDFTRGMPGNLVSMIVADYGAEVVKVDPPDGDPFGDHPAWPFWNRGKGSILVDLKTEAGLERAVDLVRRADVLVQSFRPGVMERLGLGYERVRELNPGLVYCSISAFGPDGPLAQIKGYEGIVDARTGRMLEFAGLVDPPRPAFAAVPTAGFGATHAALQGVLAALHVRRQTHRGTHVQTSLLQGNSAYDMIRWWAMQAANEDAIARDRLRSWGAYTAAIPGPFYLTAVTKDGVWLQFANFVNHTYMAQMNALGLTDLYSDPRYTDLPSVRQPGDAEGVWEAVLRRVREKTWAEWKVILDAERDVAVEPFLQVAEGFDHPQVRHNGHVVEIGGAEQLGPIVKMSETPASPTRAAPVPGDLNGVDVDGWTLPSVSPASEAPPAPLAGTLVLDFATFYATPFGGALLADLGARIIKIEPPGGEVSRFSAGGMLWYKTTAGKESLALDLKTPEGQEIVHRLLARADVVMHNFRPGAPERLGIGYEQARKLNPRIVYHYGASYGIDGPYWFKPAMHPIGGAVGGGAIQQMPASLLRPDDAELPMAELKRKAWRLQGANEGNPDVNSALGAATGILLGLQAAETLGVGQFQYTTMILSNLYANGDAGLRAPGIPPRRQPDADLLGMGALYRLYQAGDGGWIFIAVISDKEWAGFCAAVEHGEWLSDARFATRAAREEQGAALAGLLTSLFAGAPADDWVRRLAAVDVAVVRGDAASVAAFMLEEPSNLDQGFTVPVTHPLLGGYLRHGPIVTLDASPARIAPACEAGEHTRAILAELGYDAAQIERLKAKGIVGWPEDD